MGDLLKIGGKATNGNAKPFALTNDGHPIVSRPWGITVTKVFDAVEVRDTNAHTSMVSGTVIDISAYPVNSLRIRSTLDADVRISFYSDLSDDSTIYLKKMSGSGEIVIPSDNNYVNIITPADIDMLNYLKYLKLRFICDEAPTTGSLTVWHVGRS